MIDNILCRNLRQNLADLDFTGFETLFLIVKINARQIHNNGIVCLICYKQESVAICDKLL